MDESATTEGAPDGSAATSEAEENKVSAEQESADGEDEPQVEQNLELALKMKLEGNELYKQDDFQGAIDKYSLAIAHCPPSEPKQKAMIHNNLGMVLMRLHEPKPTDEDDDEGESAAQSATPSQTSTF